MPGASSSDDRICSTVDAESMNSGSELRDCPDSIDSRSERSGPITVSRTYVTNGACDSFIGSTGRKKRTAPLAPPDIGTSE
jgi:hypothetical protein